MRIKCKCLNSKALTQPRRYQLWYGKSLNCFSLPQGCSRDVLAQWSGLAPWTRAREATTVALHHQVARYSGVFQLSLLSWSKERFESVSARRHQGVSSPLPTEADSPGTAPAVHPECLL